MRYILILLMLFSVGKDSHGQGFRAISNWNETKIDDVDIVNAIYKAEGGDGATYLYGIRSIPYANKKDARRICFNTVRNQRRRHSTHECDLTFLECLAKRYCPVGADNDTGTNKYWLKNVRYFLNKN